MDISIITVNYNTSKYIRQCLDSVLSQQGIEFEIIVIDNASQDNSLIILEQYRDKNHIKLIANNQNLGFGRANNLAFKYCQGRYIFLLNPDAKFTEPNALKNMLSYMQQHPEIGIAGTHIIDSAGTKPTLPKLLYPGQKYIAPDPFAQLPGDIAWILGASMMLPRHVYEQTGGFDEDYFLYGDETDWCLRIRKAGYHIGYNAKVSVTHIARGSERNTPTYDYWHKKQCGLHLFYRKHYSPKQCALLLKRDLKRSKRRTFLLNLKQYVRKLTQTDKIKYDRHQAIINTSKKLLTENNL